MANKLVYSHSWRGAAALVSAWLREVHRVTNSRAENLFHLKPSYGSSDQAPKADLGFFGVGFRFRDDVPHAKRAAN